MATLPGQPEENGFESISVATLSRFVDTNDTIIPEDLESYSYPAAPSRNKKTLVKVITVVLLVAFITVSVVGSVIFCTQGVNEKKGESDNSPPGNSANNNNNNEDYDSDGNNNTSGDKNNNSDNYNDRANTDVGVRTYEERLTTTPLLTTSQQTLTPPLSTQDCYRPGESYLYAGNTNTASSGQECLHWSYLAEYISENPWLALYVDIGLLPDADYTEAGNKCRAITMDMVFCFISQDGGLSMDPCDVYPCKGQIDFCNPDPCLGRGNCVNVNDAYRCDCYDHYSGNRCQISECDNGSYQGNQTHTATGTPCLNWYAVIESSEFDFTLDQFPDSSWDTVKNRCRNLLRDNGAKCLIWTNYGSIGFETCGIPRC